ncbi:VWA domain-containing protein [Caulobacter sp. CCUG 60055]|uniref:vWA domain-containing protein n=1 Tax=Caulobacter sp. CCUG 60055 TaxID=2100090 RepID=UPI001FA7D91F|nr:VWA domain-containing protein [Caulobacter sp. CCUG 60055]MBQ1542057.1 VWA domain-containing protein [Caulobacteraceae bacterium]MCI3180231.1 VWA domain-containing protein [Caulobacter sp. CCUG 60055]
MFMRFFSELRQARVPVTLKEYLMLMEALDRDVIDRSVDDFYYLSRASLVKDEKNLDKFDRVFGHVFKGLERVDDGLTAEIPAEWLKALTEKFLTDEEKAQIEALGGFEKLMETLQERLKEQKERHEGGSKWIGTGGTSPFGANGYNPEGVRIGQDKGRHGRAVKVWDKREYKNLDDSVELGTRNIKVALRRLRRFARQGQPEELDVDGSIKETANKGYLDLVLRPERRNTIKVLLFFDIGGSMDSHIKLCEELFSAAKTEFKNMEFFYFHNCLYEGVWKDNRRRHAEKINTWDVLHKFPHDYKVIFVGDATMSPYEITYPGGSVEHWNEEAGAVWIDRVTQIYDSVVWLNPTPERHWDYTQSIGVMRQLMNDRMYPLTLEGLDKAMRELVRG